MDLQYIAQQPQTYTNENTTQKVRPFDFWSILTPNELLNSCHPAMSCLYLSKTHCPHQGVPYQPCSCHSSTVRRDEKYLHPVLRLDNLLKRINKKVTLQSADVNQSLKVFFQQSKFGWCLSLTIHLCYPFCLEFEDGTENCNVCMILWPKNVFPLYVYTQTTCPISIWQILQRSPVPTAAWDSKCGRNGFGYLGEWRSACPPGETCLFGSYFQLIVGG